MFRGVIRNAAGRMCRYDWMELCRPKPRRKVKRPNLSKRMMLQCIEMRMHRNAKKKAA